MMKFIKIKAYDSDTKGVHDLFLNLHNVISFEETTEDDVPIVLIITQGEYPYTFAPIEEFERLKNSVISPFCGDV